MRYVPLGRSGLRVSELCLGGVRLGEGKDGIGARESQAVLEAFMAAGGNFVDTANLYNGGASEEMLGQMIRGIRDRLIIATKFGMGQAGEAVLASGAARKSMRLSVERSLRRLGTDYIDILYLHQWDFDTDGEELMRAMGDLVERGLVDHIAVSNAPAWVVARCDTIAELRGWPRFSAMQIAYSLLDRTADREVVPMGRALGMGLCCWAPLAQGRLAGGGTPTAEDRDVIDAVSAVAERLGVSMAQVSLAWLRQQRGDMIAVVGSDSAEQIRDCAASVDLVLEPEDLARLDAVSRPTPGYPHDYLDRASFHNMRTSFQPEKIRSRHYPPVGPPIG